MSHSSLSYYPAADRPARQPSPRAQSAAAMSRHLQRTHDGYTLTHAGHQIRIVPVAFWIVVGALVVMAVWSVASAQSNRRRPAATTSPVEKPVRASPINDTVIFVPLPDR